MEEIRCIRCGRPLRDPASIARGMGAECAGVNLRPHGKFPRAAMPDSRAATTTLFTFVDENKQPEGQPLIEPVSSHRSGDVENLMQFPTDLVNLVLSRPAAGGIAGHVKKYAKKELKSSVPPGRILQEIRRICIEMRLPFWPGMSEQGQQIVCIPYGEEEWKFGNSQRVMSRKELEAYLSRYGMIRSAST